MRDVFEQMLPLLQSGQSLVLVSVTAYSGSVPGKPGAHMLIGANGRCAGTVGGGVLEKEAEKLAAALLAKRQSQAKNFNLTQGDAAGLGMVCGGTLTLWFQTLPAGAEAADFAAQLANCFTQNRQAWLLLDVTPGGPGGLGLYTHPAGWRFWGENVFGAGGPEWDALLGAVPQTAEIGGRQVYTEPLIRTGRVLIFGGGHLAQALAPLLAALEFYTVVLDDRPEFANAALFPTANEVLLGDFSDLAAQLTPQPHDYAVVVTRGHAADFEVERQLLQHPPCYVGVIGSRSKTAAVNKRLLEAGISQAALNAVYTPIGLDIGAVTPAEIAVSIAAELVAVRAGRRAGLSLKEK